MFNDNELKKLIDEGYSQRKIADKLGVARSSVRCGINRLAKKGFSPDHDMTHTVPDGFKIKGVSTYYSINPLTGVETQRGQWVKSSEDRERQAELLRETLKAMCEDLPKFEPQTIMNEHLLNNNLLAVYPLGDPHIGMMSWIEESGMSWDLKIAESIFCAAFDRVVKSAPKCKNALIVNLGDYFHYDNMDGVTSRSGHTLDVDGRYAKMVRIGVKIMRQMITSALEHHETVTIINVIGNHDDTGAIFLSVCLKNMYENEPRVIVNDSPSPFHYYRFGKVLIGTHHGHTCKMDKLPGVMAADESKNWGETDFRYWLTGHIHHDSKKEFPGCMVESFRTLAAKDAYATWGGWRSGQDTKALVYHKEYGEIERHTINIAMVTESLITK